MSEPNRPAPPASTSRNPLPLIATFVLGAVLTALWFHRQATPAVQPATTVLSETTSNVLATLPAPVMVHYYSLLAGGADPQLQAFAGRAGDLLKAMQEASGGKLHVSTIATPADTNANAAGAEGLQVFNLDKGEADYLGVSLASGPNKETMARLEPAYEAALESDLIRAIQRVAILPAAVAPAQEVVKPSSEMVASIHRLIPDVAGTPTDTASQIFHAEFLKELSDASTDMDTQMQAAQQRVMTAQTNGSPTELAAAQQNLARVQLAQSEKIRHIAAELKTRQAVYEQMKAGTN